MNLKESNGLLYEDLMLRMKRIEGQARGLQRMLDEGADCEQVLMQLAAMKAALHRVGLKVAACSMGTRYCETASAGGDTNAVIDEMIEQFLRLG